MLEKNAIGGRSSRCVELIRPHEAILEHMNVVFERILSLMPRVLDHLVVPTTVCGKNKCTLDLP